MTVQLIARSDTMKANPWAANLQSLARLKMMLRNSVERFRVVVVDNNAGAGRHYRDCSKFLSKSIANEDTRPSSPRLVQVGEN
jgi:hypothetical protein